MGLPRSRAREQRGRVCVRWPFQAASAHRVVGICRPASVGALLMRPLPLGTMQNLLQTFERPSDKRRRARHRARHLRRSRLLLMKRWSRWAPERRAGKPSAKKWAAEQPTRPAAKAKPATKAVDKAAKHGAQGTPDEGGQGHRRQVRAPVPSRL